MSATGVGAAVLLVDDNWQVLRPLLANLSGDLRVITEAESCRALERLDENPDVGAVLLDLRFEGQAKQGERTLDEIKERYPDLPVIVLTAVTDVALALRLVHEEKKAHYYFVKDQVDTDQLAKAVENAVGYYRLKSESLRRTDRGLIVGTSAALQAVLRAAAKAAQTSSTVLLTGEPGTGKELVARVIHLNGARHDRPFIAVNCGAIPDELVESELFGTVAGAFTQARERKGYFEAAHGGTLLLDEVGELPLSSQAALLRAVESGEIQRVGGGVRVVDVRLITATNRDLAAAARDDRFRQDLYYRLNIIRIHLPPLRERAEDIPLLVEHFLATEFPGKAVAPEALVLLQRQPWPGNVRELFGAIHQAAVLSDSDVLDASAFAGYFGSDTAVTSDPAAQWVRRIFSGEASWGDLRGEFRTSGEMLRSIVDGVIRRWKETHGDRPSGNELAALLRTNRNHVNQILDQLGLRLRDYD